MRNLLRLMRKPRPAEPAAADALAPAKKRKRHRVLWSTVALLVIAAPFALWFLPSFGVRYVMLQQLRNAGLSTVDIAEVNVSLLGGQVGVRRASGNAPAGPEARLADLDIAFEWQPLLNRRVSLGNVAMRGLQLEVSHAADDGRLVISGLPLPNAVASPDEPGAPGWLIGIDRMRISESTLVYIRNSQRITLAIDSLVVERLRAWDPESPGRIDFAGSFNGATVAVSGEFAPFATRQNAHLKMHASGIDIARIASIFADPELYELRGSLDFDLTAAASITPGASVTATFDGTASVNEMVMGLAGVRLRADRFGWAGNFNTSPVDASAAGKLLADTVTLDMPDGQFALASAAAEVDPVSVRFGGVPQIAVDWTARLKAEALRFKTADAALEQGDLTVAVRGFSDGPQVAFTASEIVGRKIAVKSGRDSATVASVRLATEKLKADLGAEPGPEAEWEGRLEVGAAKVHSGDLDAEQDGAAWDGKVALQSDGDLALTGTFSLDDAKLSSGPAKAAVASLKAALRPLRIASTSKVDWKGRLDLGASTFSAPGVAAEPAKLAFDGSADIDFRSAPRGRVAGKVEIGRTRTTLADLGMWVEHQGLSANTTLTLNGSAPPTAQTTASITGLSIGSSATPIDYLVINRLDVDTARLLADGGMTAATIRATKLQTVQRRRQGKDPGYPWRAEVARATITGLARAANGSTSATAVDLESLIARVTNTAAGIQGLEVRPPTPAAAPPHPPPPVSPRNARARPAAAPPPSPRPAEPARIAVGRFEIKGDSRLLFEDQAVAPAVKLTLSPVALRVDGLDSAKPGQSNPLRAAAKHGDFGELKLTGTVRPFAPKLNLDVKAAMKGFNLPAVSPYTAQILGVHLRTGRFDGDLAMKVTDEKLDGTTTLVVSNLELSDMADGKLAASTGMPVETVVGLLQDGDGVIRLTIPITGELSDPQFDLNDAIGQAVSGAIRNTASTLLSVVFPVAGLLEAAEESQTRDALGLRPVEYAPGSADLSDSHRSYLANLAKLLGQKPGLKLNICAYAAPRDWPAMHAARVAAEEAAAAPKTSVGIAARQAGNLMRGALGVSKEPPPPTPPADTDALRELAAERSRAVKLFLTQSGSVTEERLFECLPEVESDAAAKPRVEVKL